MRKLTKNQRINPFLHFEDEPDKGGIGSLIDPCYKCNSNEYSLDMEICWKCLSVSGHMRCLQIGFDVLRLTTNMRLQHMAQDNNFEAMSEFAKWIASIGDGLAREENDGVGEGVGELRDLSTSSVSPLFSVRLTGRASSRSNCREPSPLSSPSTLGILTDVLASSLRHAQQAGKTREELQRRIHSDSSSIRRFSR
ncbi:unnamed protein product [Cuscuta campestris]|uniref:ATP-dependent DNA helicase n=1 Tax=Cuscuta campestris TaxID=132261 RepID=A0A484KIU6_9ASTE|nr:unnamed protein product [Cuscuta campestris]